MTDIDLKAELESELTRSRYHELARRLSATTEATASVRVAILSTCSMEFGKPYIIVEGARSGLSIVPFFGPFGQIEQQIEDERSSLYEFGPDVLVVIVRPEDVSADLTTRPFAPASVAIDAYLGELVDRIVRAAERFRAASTKHILVANFADIRLPPLGPFEASSANSLSVELARANAHLSSRIKSVPGASIWDLAGLIRGVGTERWADDRLWFLARVPVAAEHQPKLAAHLARTIRATQVPPAKCLVLDLDNTLWGGVIGDDGIGGIQLGDDFPGNVFKDFQRRVLALSDRGILLAVVSKNNENVVREVFDRHPEMLIKWTDIAAARINWEPKSKNIRDIARELNIGSDQLVFFDDNPVERAEVAANAPEVLVADVPSDPIGYSQCLSSLRWFDQVTVSDEDRVRSDLYRQQRSRAAAATHAGSVEEFLGSLNMTAEIGLLNETTLARVAQLISKTNQFNLTTRRYTVGELASMMQSPDRYAVAWIRVADRFGDQGLVGVAITEWIDTVARIDVFLMSCRVMNRHVEQALLASVAEQARARGCTLILGEYIETAKNSVVRNLYTSFGFTMQEKPGNWYQLDLTNAQIEWPAVIRRIDSV